MTTPAPTRAKQDTRTLYVSVDNEPFWDAAQAAADARNISLSSYAAEALAAYNASQGHEDPAALARRAAALARRLANILSRRP